MRLLLISNSTNAGEEYLRYPMPYISDFLGKKGLQCAFIPYAGVTISYENYISKVRERFESIGQKITSVHETDEPLILIEKADVIVVGGGNTFQLLKKVQEMGMIDPIKKRVLKGTPYIGWSAGANMACPTIRTTNDMPVVQPESFEALNLVPFQINPHYLDVNPDGHAGETREARIEEFIHLNRDIKVAGLREGTMLRIEDHVHLLGPRKMRLFEYGKTPIELEPGSKLDFLLK